MAKVVCLPCCLILLVFLIDPGDGQWKKLRLSELKHDVFVLEKMAENLEHEIEDIYDETLHTGPRESPRRTHHHRRKHKTHIGRSKLTTHTPNITADLKKNVEYNNPLRLYPKEAENPKKVIPKINISDIYWPKFEEILSMNKRKYDWKNDRWIKLNEVTPHVVGSKVKEEVGPVHKSKHRFNYRRVKLDSGKAKGNVVIAVSAVR